MTLTLRRLVPALRCAGLVDADIVSGRHVQATVYLMERAGANLGYHYGWEMFGPFSEGLAQALNETTQRIVDHFNDAVPNDVTNASACLDALRNRKPADYDDNLWLRLVASVDFLEHRSKISVDNGSTPPYVEAFGREAIDAAKAAATEVLSRPGSQPAAA